MRQTKQILETPPFCYCCNHKIQLPDTPFICRGCNAYFCPSCLKNLTDQYKFCCPRCQKEVDSSQSSRMKNTLSNFPQLVDVRVMQHDLVYIVGLPISIAHEDVLLKYEYFGQYGPIKKIAINSQHLHSSPVSPTPSVSAYVTFRNPEDAIECIYSLENFVTEGIPVKACFGTTKYCSSFLRGQKCANPDCMYLHHVGDQSDSFSKEEIAGSCPRFIETTRPTRPPDYDDYFKQDSRPTIFPYRRILKKKDTVSMQHISPCIQMADFSMIEASIHSNQSDAIFIENPPMKALSEQLNICTSSPRNIFSTIEYLNQK